MGLFSFLNKNKQDRSTQDSGRFVRPEDEAPAERARRRSAQGAEGGRRKVQSDPVLPEKKRARRRLVGAVALALAAAVVLPMLLDSEPKPLAGDIAIQIPSQEKAAPLPLPSHPAPVAAADAVDSDEEIIEPSAAVPADRRAVAPVDTTAPAHRAEPARPEHKPDMSRYEPVRVAPEPKAAPKPEPKVASVKAAGQTPPKAAAKADEKPAARPQPANDAARALAILEGKQAAARQESSSQRFVVQVAALASQEKVSELQARLRGAGIATFTQKQSTPSGELIRVRAGPHSRDEAEKLRARLQGLGLSGTLVPL